MSMAMLCVSLVQIPQIGRFLGLLILRVSLLLDPNVNPQHHTKIGMPGLVPRINQTPLFE